MQRYLLNPPVKLLAWLGVLPGHALIETQGRRSGKRRRNVVGIRVDDGTGWIVAEHGRHAGYVRNLQADPNVRVRLGAAGMTHMPESFQTMTRRNGWTASVVAAMRRPSVGSALT